MIIPKIKKVLLRSKRLRRIGSTSSLKRAVLILDRALFYLAKLSIQGYTTIENVPIDKLKSTLWREIQKVDDQLGVWNTDLDENPFSLLL